MSKFLWQALVTLFVSINPFAVVPIFVCLTRNDTQVRKRKTSYKATIIATILLLSFAFVGDKLLDALSVPEPAFRIAGGFLLLLVAILVVAKSSGLRTTTVDGEPEAAQRDNISIFPLATPLIAGPATLTSIVVLMRQAETMGFHVEIGVVLILMCVLLFTYFSLLIGDRLMKVLSVTGTNVITCIFAIILGALAVQNIINGTRVLFG